MLELTSHGLIYCMARPVDLLDLTNRAIFYLSVILLALQNSEIYIKMPRRNLLTDFIKNAVKNPKKYPNLYWISKYDGLFGIRKQYAGNKDYDHKYDNLYKDWEDVVQRKKSKTDMKQRLFAALRKSPYFEYIEIPNIGKEEIKIYKFKASNTGTDVSQPSTFTGTGVSQSSTYTNTAVSQPSTSTGLPHEPQVFSGFKSGEVEPQADADSNSESSHQHVESIQNEDHTYAKTSLHLLLTLSDPQLCFPNLIFPHHEHQPDTTSCVQHQTSSTYMDATSVMQFDTSTDAWAPSMEYSSVNQPNLEAKQFLPNDSQESMVDSPPAQVPAAYNLERETSSPTLYNISTGISLEDEWEDTFASEDFSTISDKQWAETRELFKNRNSFTAEENEHPLDDSSLEIYGNVEACSDLLQQSKH